MPRRPAPKITDETLVETIVIDFFERTVPIFLRNRREHPNHDRETCFQETIEELRQQCAAAETETRRSSGA
jgi:hypothetical protein